MGYGTDELLGYAQGRLLTVSGKPSNGFGLIELMIAITIVALLTVLGAPSYSSWITNTRIRNASESIQNGLRLARSEAVQRAVPVRFEVGSGTADWEVCVPAAATPSTCSANIATLQSAYAIEGASAVRVGGTTTSGTSTASDLSINSASGKGVTFDPLGRARSGTMPLLRIDASSALPDARRLVVLISTEGSVRMCDPSPNLPAGSAQACP